jgi:hypothetical protein
MDPMKKNVVSKMHMFSNEAMDNSNCGKSGPEEFMNHSCLQTTFGTLVKMFETKYTNQRTSPIFLCSE